MITLLKTGKKIFFLGDRYQEEVLDLVKGLLLCALFFLFAYIVYYIKIFFFFNLFHL